MATKHEWLEVKLPLIRDDMDGVRVWVDSGLADYFKTVDEAEQFAIRLYALDARHRSR